MKIKVLYMYCGKVAESRNLCSMEIWSYTVEVWWSLTEMFHCIVWTSLVVYCYNNINNDK